MTEINPQTIDDARQGDRAALEILVGQAEGIMRRVAHQFSGADADDLVQNSLIKLTQSIHQLVDPKSFSGWCTAIARNEIRMFQRGAKRREQAQLQFGFEPRPTAEQTSTPDIQSAVTKLPSSQQLIIQELYVANRSYQEIADSMDLPISAVKSRLHRARNRLKRELDMQSNPQAIQLSKDDLESLKQAALFCYKGEDRDHLAGIYLDKSGYAVGTDGHHLVVRSLPNLSQLEDNLLVDARSITAIDVDAKLTVHMDEVQITTSSDQVALNISQETFPDYRTVMPSNQPVACSINRVAVTNLVTRARANLSHAEGTTDTVLFTLDLESELLKLESNQQTSPDSTFTMSYELPVTSPSNKLGMVKMALNINLLAECLSAVDGESISLGASAWNQPLDIVGETHRTVLMTIKL